MRTRQAPPGPGPAVFRHTVGNALVLHVGERISAAARSLALAIAADPDHDIVVLDLHDDLPAGVWASLAAVLNRPRRGIRLVVCGVPADTAALAAQWLCDRLRRPVVTPHGRPIRTASGTLFAVAASGGGWVRYRPRRQPVRESTRYPAPAWDTAAARFTPTSATGAVEPIPAGVWIRDSRDPGVVGSRWPWLAAAVPCQPEAMTVVLGCPGTPPLAVDDVARFWRGLDPDGRRHARFVQYGPVQSSAGELLGQRLADVLASPVVCLTGIPVGRPDRPELRTVTADGRLGWQPLVRELAFTPRAAPAAAAVPPRILSHQAPALLGDPVGPLTYRYARDAVVEIVQSGLWIRAAGTPRHAVRVRAHPADPDRHALIVDDTFPARVRRFRELAEDLAARLDPATRARSVLRLASAVATGPGWPAGDVDGDPDDALTYRFTAADLALDEVAPDDLARDDVTLGALARDDVVRVAPSLGAGPPAGAAPTRPPAPAPPDGLDAARAWLRQRFGTEFDTAASAISRLVAEHPPLRDGDEPVTDAVAVRLYLSAAGRAVDRALRSDPDADDGALLFARCVLAGAGRLPAHRGATWLSADLSAAELRGIAARRVLTEPGFTHALTEPPVTAAGNVDVLLWSMTARLTRLLEPVGEQHVDHRVIFLPGVRFVVLEVTAPGRDRPGRVLLRELAADEPARHPGPFDALASTSLLRSLDRWTATGRRSRVGPAAAARFTRLPGLV
ncbi:hypothetical protein O7606_03515 [Micromonospora sp. WMMD882]|uniref:hypothetical protein n=1 Tax=Micromonospora sp. WMMD882 TaxID=3015151 RepID=UPI00248BF407|nr:hypothetical protein [Micromonospora sp. WMMD882]WBB80464.1 hypothetical protein O7606_03515 [Micromonospora sp. WMMD882]